MWEYCRSLSREQLSNAQRALSGCSCCVYVTLQKHSRWCLQRWAQWQDTAFTSVKQTAALCIALSCPRRCLAGAVESAQMSLHCAIPWRAKIMQEGMFPNNLQMHWLPTSENSCVWPISLGDIKVCASWPLVTGTCSWSMRPRVCWGKRKQMLAVLWGGKGRVVVWRVSQPCRMREGVRAMQNCL